MSEILVSIWAFLKWTVAHAQTFMPVTALAVVMLKARKANRRPSVKHLVEALVLSLLAYEAVQLFYFGACHSDAHLGFTIVIGGITLGFVALYGIWDVVLMIGTDSGTGTARSRRREKVPEARPPSE